jgi:electron transport complex protein RnfC
VKKIETRLCTGNPEQMCVVIEGDGSDRTAFLPVLDPFACTKADALKRVHDAGIVGMGGAAFPTHVKLNPPAGKQAEYLIANAAECEPYLTVDKYTMEESPTKCIDGIAIAMHITGAAQGIVALEDNKQELKPVLEKAVADAGCAGKIEVRLCKTKYPQGGEKSLIQAVTGREIPSGGLPVDAGCVVQNVGTLCAISDAFREGKPLIERSLTISGGGCETPRNLRVPMGTVIADLEPEIIKVSAETVKIISGGPMMGIAMPSSNFPVAKNTSGVLFLTAAETDVTPEGPCLGCGKCVSYCPSRLSPVLMVRSLKISDIDAACRFGLMDCAECGACAFVCPAHIPLVQHFKVGKALVRNTRAAQQKKQGGK